MVVYMGRYRDVPTCPNNFEPGCGCRICDPQPRRGGNRWEKTTASVNRDSGIAQTNFFSGTVGETNQKKKVHVAIDEYGQVIYVRDEDGTVLYDKKNNIGHLPHDLNWSRF